MKNTNEEYPAIMIKAFSNSEISQCGKTGTEGKQMSQLGLPKTWKNCLIY
jgi:hypothetical protein